MDYSEFDALPSKTDEISISEKPSHDGIRDMPSLEKAGEIISARITEIGRTPSEIADRSGVSESIVTDMAERGIVPLEAALRVFATLGVKPYRVPPEYLEA
ncbi:hypothetical protein ABG885_03730 [Bifidobacterium longum]